MAPKMTWVLGIVLSVAVLVVIASMQKFYLHMAVAAIVGILMAFVAVAEIRKVRSASATSEAATAVAMQHMGLVWAWGSLGLLATYAPGILTWREWLSFFTGFVLLAGLTLFLAATLRRDLEKGASDPMLAKVARGFSLFILVAMIITMVGLLIDGKMWRFTTVPGQRPGSQDWGANNFFFFGALALSIISANIVKMTGAQQSKAV